MYVIDVMEKRAVFSVEKPCMVCNDVYAGHSHRGPVKLQMAAGEWSVLMMALGEFVAILMCGVFRKRAAADIGQFMLGKVCVIVSMRNALADMPLCENNNLKMVAF